MAAVIRKLSVKCAFPLSIVVSAAGQLCSSGFKLLSSAEAWLWVCGSQLEALLVLMVLVTAECWWLLIAR